MEARDVILSMESEHGSIYQLPSNHSLNQLSQISPRILISDYARATLRTIAPDISDDNDILYSHIHDKIGRASCRERV